MEVTCVPNITFTVCVYIYIYEQKYLKNKSVYRVKYLYF